MNLSINSVMQKDHISALTLNQLKSSADTPFKMVAENSFSVEGLVLWAMQKSQGLLQNQCIEKTPPGLWSWGHAGNH